MPEVTQNWVYVKSERSLFTVGFYAPDGEWHSDTDWGTSEEAAARIHYLNGGCTTCQPTK